MKKLTPVTLPQNPLLAGLNSQKMTGGSLHFDIKEKDPDVVSLKILFRAASALQLNSASQILDDQGQVIPGITASHIAGEIYTAHCSINGLIKLSNDPRVTSYAFPTRMQMHTPDA